ncbi:hypothetical protein F5Y15DRAFT_122226 [Xylariaceae sp. FL0016]|nr:hypothetical protein F5Y15DRAFT_122226 [Xylariaceae sp. FL0016]
MFTQTLGLVALSTLSMVSAQSDSNSTWTIDASNVTIQDAVAWCQGQTDSCGTLCGTAIVNNCDTTSLNFECECEGNSFPDMNLYMNTMPYFVCERLQDNCIVANENDANGQKNCTDTFGDNCPSEKVADHAGEGAATTSSASSTASATASATGGASSSTATGAAAMPTVQAIGNGVAVAAVALFAYAL